MFVLIFLLFLSYMTIKIAQEPCICFFFVFFFLLCGEKRDGDLFHVLFVVVGI